MRVISIATMVCASLAVGHSTMSFGAEKLIKKVYARICDASSCYLVWNVVDSDRDGVCDADELMAGTDPYNPLSKPSLRVVVAVAGKAQLPSFEAGLGAFFVFPEKLQGMIKETQEKPLSAFPLTWERADSLTRLGISSDQMTNYGIDPMRDGFTIGFDREAKDPFPERRVGGVELRLISEEDDPVPFDSKTGQHGAVVAFSLGENGSVRSDYEDGYYRVEYTDGSGFVADKDGNIVGEWYVNPDADQTATAPTPEQEAAVLRLRGAAIRTIEGWSSPDFSDTKPRDTRPTIILVDPQYAENPAQIFDAPNLTTAQPEVRPDLPSPGVQAPSGGFDCTKGC